MREDSLTGARNVDETEVTSTALDNAHSEDTHSATLRVTLYTTEASFEQRWNEALSAKEVLVEKAHPEQLPSMTERGDIVVLDADCDAYDEDELLAHTSLVEALGAKAIVAIGKQLDSAVGDVLEDLCPGRIVRDASDMDRNVRALIRQADTERVTRFEYLTVSPRDAELLVLFSDGRSVLVERPLNEDDDLSAIVGIVLDEDAQQATLSLETGGDLVVTSSLINQRVLLAGSNGADGTIDGVRLGKRIRQLRLAAKLTQAELARRTGIHRPNIARVEAGRHTPSLETLARLAGAIGVPTTRVLED